MTRRNYEQIARAMLASKPGEMHHEERHKQYRLAVARVSEVLKADNPRFDKEKFYKACGI